MSSAAAVAAAYGCQHAQQDLRKESRHDRHLVIRPFIIKIIVIMTTVTFLWGTSVTSFPMVIPTSSRIGLRHHHNSMTTTTCSSFSHLLALTPIIKNRSCRYYRLGDRRMMQLSLSSSSEEEEKGHANEDEQQQPKPKKKSHQELWQDLTDQLQQQYHLPPAPDVMPLAPHQRLVAIGDVHGDVSQLQRCLELAGLLDYSNTAPKTAHGYVDENANDYHVVIANRGAPKWCGGNTICVLCGDVLDRGVQELACFRLICDLAKQAPLEGGIVTMLWGNHEAMNAYGDFEYAYKPTTDKEDPSTYRWDEKGNFIGKNEEEVDEYELEFGRVLDEMHELKCQATKKTTTENTPASSWRDAYDTPSSSSRRAVTPSQPFRWIRWYPSSPFQDAVRWATYEPGGLMAKPLLSNLKVAIIVEKTVLVHGGLALEHLELARTLAKEEGDTNKKEVKVPATATTLDGPPLIDNTGKVPAPWGWDAIATMNRLARDWVLSSPLTKSSSLSEEDEEPSRFKKIRVSMPPFLKGRPLWFRAYSYPSDRLPYDADETKTKLENVLTALNVDRMVVGHTIQKKGINAVFDGQVWRVDVGMSRGCLTGGPEVLEITMNECGQEVVRVLTLKPMTPLDNTTKTYLSTSLPETERYLE